MSPHRYLMQWEISAEQCRVRRNTLPVRPSGFRVSALREPQGRPGMPVQKFVKWQQRSASVSLKVVTPSGQYDPTKLSIGEPTAGASNPSLAYSERWGHLVARWVCGSLVLYEKSRSSFPQRVLSARRPIAEPQSGRLRRSSQLRVSLGSGSRSMAILVRRQNKFKWVRKSSDLQRNSRIGGTASIP